MSKNARFPARHARRVRQALEWIIIGVLVFICHRNLREFEKIVSALPQTTRDELVVQEERYGPIRTILSEAGYTSGPIAFITNRDLTGKGRLEEDDVRWSQGQYAMIPWILLRNGRSVSGPVIPDFVPTYTIADFWDGEPASPGEQLETLYDSGSGLFLFRNVTTP